MNNAASKQIDRGPGPELEVKRLNNRMFFLETESKMPKKDDCGESLGRFVQRLAGEPDRPVSRSRVDSLVGDSTESSHRQEINTTISVSKPNLPS